MKEAQLYETQTLPVQSEFIRREQVKAKPLLIQWHLNLLACKSRMPSILGEPMADGVICLPHLAITYLMFSLIHTSWS